MPNRLGDETSPYLLQHKDNPVDWYPWGDEAFAAAAESNRPILLSVGYSTCHWCHVMERESFEDQDTADLMNRHFVSVKVDREERPDVDSIYMDAVNAMTGRGGWPMTVFLTPGGEPFYAGTYFPDQDRHGMPSFQRVLGAISEAWLNRRHELVEQAAELTKVIGQALPSGGEAPDGTAVAGAYHTIAHQFDEQHGGLGGAPKFPQEPVLEFLLRLHDAPWAPQALDMLTRTLDRMAAGGIYDHLGGGFSRYAVDRIWLVPHFEKMLYDNAELARLYTRAWQVTGRQRYRTVATETLDYVLRDLRHPAGGISAAEDADSEGVEGKFYVFEHDEFNEVVGPDDGPMAATYFGVTQEGNFEGSNVLHEAQSLESVARLHSTDIEEVAAAVERAKTALLERRAGRIRPGMDTKVITAWNGLALRALAVAGAAFGEERYIRAARDNARFVLGEMRMTDGRLFRTWSDGAPTIPGYLEDHAAYALGLLELYQSTGERQWLDSGLELVDLLEPHFGGEAGVVYASAADSSHLVVRPADQQDNPTASGASMAAEAFLIAGLLTGRTDHHDRAARIIEGSARLIDQAPAAAGHALAVASGMLRGFREVALLGPEADDWRARLATTYRPTTIVASSVGPEEAVPLLAGRFRPDQTLAYVCESMVCQAPVGSYEELIEAV